ncbi:MAG: NADH:ubiquinone reductase (Na(+)-transporting) subunit C [Paludibacter sp.]|jgi:Na+-transporting NADH:ubiquinone oxidoreductase subunit C|nr:NADH:ubiquinone reductase (Na(+)-transporting) subunit C [Paludibacter sp.]
MNTNNNSYTLLYATVMVVIVALLLALVSGSLKEKQTTNVELDKMKQILSSLNIDTQGQDAKALWSKYIAEEQVINSNAEVIASPKVKAFDIVLKKELAKPLEQRELPLFVASVDGSKKYIISLFGAGLWGPIWGYIALNEDMNTIYGTYFSHSSETPGLGAEIALKAFQEKFIGKSILNDQREFMSIAIVKPGQTAEGLDYVDGISGGTITSKGVEKMLQDCLGQYATYFKQSTMGGTVQ